MSAEDIDPDLRLLRVQLESAFVMSGGRIERVNDPDRSAAPRLCLSGCEAGNLVFFRRDVGERTAGSILDLVRAEPPWSDLSAPPRCLDAMVELLSVEAPAQVRTPALNFVLPHNVRYAAGATIIRGDAAEGARLLARLMEDGMPAHLIEGGFAGVGDFWAPWCAAIVDGVIAAMAFAARLGPFGADVGVYTFPGFRGHGLAAAVTASWSSLPSLAGRELFYSTHQTNCSSQRVAARLGLRQFGVSIAID